jgi:hypothetical protein
MGKKEREKKQVKRLALRREVLRVLSTDTLGRVAGGFGVRCEDTDGNGCSQSVRPTGP